MSDAMSSNTPPPAPMSCTHDWRVYYNHGQQRRCTKCGLHEAPCSHDWQVWPDGRYRHCPKCKLSERVPAAQTPTPPAATAPVADLPLRACHHCRSTQGLALCKPLPPDHWKPTYLCGECWNDYYQQASSDQAEREARHEVTR